jgi:GNAT superfamily N-acetyltransferase
VARRREHLSRPDGVAATLVAEVDGATIGFTNYGPYGGHDDPNSAAPSAGGGEVYAIYVEPERYRTGAGYALMDAAVAGLTERGLTPVRVWVLAGNARAFAFYQRYGFRDDDSRGTFPVQQPGELPVQLELLRLVLG